MKTKTEFTFTLSGSVDNPEHLYEKAYEFAERELGNPGREEVDTYLRREDGTVNIEACVIAILDQPLDGCDTYGSDCITHEVAAS